MVRERDSHQEGIAIIALDGKTKMDKPAYIFSVFGIPTFVVFDNDSKKKGGDQHTKANILLQKICGVANPVEMPAGCNPRFAALDNDLETYLAKQVGNDFDKLMSPIAQEFGLSYGDVKKTLAAVQLLFRRAKEEGHEFPLFDQLIGNVDALT